MKSIIDADKMNKIIYYAEQARKSYEESLRQKKISEEFLHKACKLILDKEPFEYTDKELIRPFLEDSL